MSIECDTTYVADFEASRIIALYHEFLIKFL